LRELRVGDMELLGAKFCLANDLPVIENSVAQHFRSLRYLLQPERIDAFFVMSF
jgi:hypothetical protein